MFKALLRMPTGAAGAKAAAEPTRREAIASFILGMVGRNRLLLNGEGKLPREGENRVVRKMIQEKFSTYSKACSRVVRHRLSKLSRPFSPLQNHVAQILLLQHTQGLIPVDSLSGGKFVGQTQVKYTKSMTFF
jgi:hypothetical protein